MDFRTPPEEFQGMASAVRLTDGTFDFSGGVDSATNRTVQSAANPNGLLRTQLAWLTNGTVRNGDIGPRSGWQTLVPSVTHPALYQGGFLYEPNFANPYLILSIGGHLYSVLVDPPYTVTDLSLEFGLTNPSCVAQAFFEQCEQFLVVQSGDIFTNPKPTLPLFWDGTKLRRSNGITGNLSGPNINELPAAGPMVYYQGRLWYAQGRQYAAGDIVDDQASGSAIYNFDDAILRVTENPIALGGDGFRLPARAGNITALFFTTALDTTFGQGPLYIGTRKQIYQLQVPVTRANWIAANNQNQPLQTLAQINFGPVSDRSIVHVNGDVFYQSLEPAIRSLFLSLRYFSQWGNVAISRNEDRILAFNNRALMPFATGIQFDNRLLMGISPVQTPVGVGFQAIAPLDFDIISSFGRAATVQPAWEGIYEGLDFLQLFEGDFGGLPRAFGVVHSRVDNSIQVLELSNSLLFDGGDKRVVWSFETPCYTFQREFEMKKLDGGEIWIDQIAGTVDLKVEYRVDADACWQLWHQTQFCAARNQCEDAVDPFCSNYPLPSFCQGYQFPVTLPEPQPGKCTMMKRPTTIGYQFQVRLTVKGWCNVVAMLLFGITRERQPYEQLSC